MKKYEVIYCFLDKNGYVESDEFGEIVYKKRVKALDETHAVEVLKEKENFIQEPQIIEVVDEVQKIRILCKKLGIENNRDINRFLNEVKHPNESVLGALERYWRELGEQFKILEDLEQ